MLRRAGIVLTASMAFLALWAGVAQALCPIAQFDGVLRSSDGVWWATVTEAEVSQSGSPGYWTFKVDIHDSLKGPGVDGGTGTVYFSVCGPFLSQQGKREAAEGFVGQTMLFMGREHDGGLITGSLFFRPNLQPSQQYERALADLQVEAPSSPLPGLPSSESGKTPVIAFVLGAGALVAIVLAVIALTLWARRRKTTES